MIFLYLHSDITYGTSYQQLVLCLQINVQVNFDKYVQPLGLGPGAVASLYRILLKR